MTDGSPDPRTDADADGDAPTIIARSDSCYVLVTEAVAARNTIDGSVPARLLNTTQGVLSDTRLLGSITAHVPTLDFNHEPEEGELETLLEQVETVDGPPPDEIGTVQD